MTKPLIYLSNSGHSVSTNATNTVPTNFQGLETMLKDYGFDVYFETRRDSREFRPEHFDGVAGVIILGGPDVGTELYGRTNDFFSYSNALDTHQMNVLDSALLHNIPLLGVCRGMQLMNVFFGGTLHQEVQDISKVPHNFFQSKGYGDARFAFENVKVENSNYMDDVVANVAHAHHQSAEIIAPDFTVTAQCYDGVVEMIEAPHLKMVGTQWHPEYTHLNQDDTLSPLIESMFVPEMNVQRAPIAKQFIS